MLKHPVAAEELEEEMGDCQNSPFHFAVDVFLVRGMLTKAKPVSQPATAVACYILSQYLMYTSLKRSDDSFKIVGRGRCIMKSVFDA